VPDKARSFHFFRGQVTVYEVMSPGRVRFYWIDESNKASAGYFFSREAAEKDAIQHANKKEDKNDLLP